MSSPEAAALAEASEGVVVALLAVVVVGADADEAVVAAGVLVF